MKTNDSKQKQDTIEYSIQTTNNTLPRHNYKISKFDEKDICINYLLSKNSREAMLKKYNISKRAYYDIINKNKENGFKLIDKDITELRQNFTKQTTLLMNKAIDKLNKQLESDDNVNLSQLATVLGILYDKEALELGKSTSNQAFNINIKIDK